MDRRVKQWLSLACVGVFTLAMAGSSRAQNLLTDPGFENDTTTTDPNHTGVPGWAPANLGNGSLDQDLTTPVALGGTNVWELTGGTSTNNNLFNVPLAYEVFSVTAGQTYVFSGNIYLPSALTSGGNDFALLQLGFFTGAAPSNYVGGTELSSASSPNEGQPGGAASNLPVGQWVSMVVTGTAANVGLQHVNSMGAYMIDVNQDSSSTYYFDNMSLTLLVPEPSTVALVLTSLAGGFLFFRKRRK